MKKPKTWVLTDEKRKIWIEKLEIRPKDLDLAHENWSIRKKSLRGGSCDGVDLIEIFPMVNIGFLIYSTIRKKRKQSIGIRNKKII